MDKKVIDDLNVYMNLVDEILIEHSSFMEADRTLERCLLGAKFATEPVCAAIIADSRGGKSRVLENFESKYPRIRTDEGLTVPVLLASVQSNPTVKGLAQELLYKLDDPLYNKGTEYDKTNRLKTLLASLKTTMLALDEFNHFVDQATNRVQHKVTDWLKVLVDETKLTLVVAGLPHSVAVINSNKQLKRRFLAPVKIRRFKWTMSDRREEFINVLHVLQEELRPFEFPTFDTDEMAFRFYCGTGGVMGLLMKTIKEAIALAIMEGRTVITLGHLADAHRIAIWEEEGFLSKAPFSPHFKLAEWRAYVKQLAEYEAKKSKITRKAVERVKPVFPSEVLTTR